MRLRNIVLFTCIMMCCSLSVFSAEELSLNDAINKYVYNTIYVRSKCLALQNRLLEYENFKKSFLPALSLNLTPVSFNHSMRLLQNYNTGEYSNVEEFSNTSSGGITVSQKIAATGGIITVGSSLSYLHEFTEDNNSFSTSPVYISYSQQLFGGGKNMSFERAISKLRNDVALKDFCTSVSTEQQKILSLYLNAYSNRMDIEFYSKTTCMGDSLLMHAKIRKDAGKITEYEYNLVEMQQLDNKIELEESQSAYATSIRLLEKELRIYDIELKTLSPANFPAYIEESDVIKLVNQNNPTYQNLELERLNAEYRLHQKKTDNRFNANISLSYGLNQYAKTFKDAYRHPDQRQSASVTLSIPVFQWGINRNKLKIAKNEYEMALQEQESAISSFKEEIHVYVTDYNLSKGISDAAEKKYHLAGQQYSFASLRFNMGKISAIELSNAHKDYLQAKQYYISVIRNLFENYYKIRHLSLYDFAEGKNLLDLVQTSIKE